MLLHEPVAGLEGAEWLQVLPRDAALLALVDLVFRCLQFVTHEFELGALGKIADREDRLEHLLQPDAGAVLGFHPHLQEVVVRTPLHLDQVGHRSNLGNAPEVFADPLLAVEGYRHLCPSLWAAPVALKGARAEILIAATSRNRRTRRFRDAPTPGVRNLSHPGSVISI